MSMRAVRFRPPSHAVLNKDVKRRATSEGGMLRSMCGTQAVRFQHSDMSLAGQLLSGGHGKRGQTVEYISKQCVELDLQLLGNDRSAQLACRYGASQSAKSVSVLTTRALRTRECALRDSVVVKAAINQSSLCFAKGAKQKVVSWVERGGRAETEAFKWRRDCGAVWLSVFAALR